MVEIERCVGNIRKGLGEIYLLYPWVGKVTLILRNSPNEAGFTSNEDKKNQPNSV